MLLAGSMINPDTIANMISLQIWYHCRFKREMHGTPL